MNKNLTLIGIQEENLMFLKQQLEIVFTGQIPIKTITLKDLNFESILETDIVLLTGNSIHEIVRPFLPPSCACVVAKRTENIINMKELLYLQGNKNVLVVNDNEEDTIQTTKSIQAVLPDHTYVPYLMNRRVPENIDLVVTPGESQLIPGGLPKVFDIGPRVISIDTLMDINDRFNLHINQGLLTQLYIKAMVFLSGKKVIRHAVSIDDENYYRNFGQLNTKSPILKSTIQIAKKIAQTRNPIHIEGEVGTGKRMFAEMIHNHSSLSTRPLYVYNCLDKEPEMIKEELFDQDRGIMNSMTTGTIYIKNMDNLPYSLQGNLLEIIEHRTTNNVRLITSSSENLRNLLQKGILRTEIYAYLSPYTLNIIPLAERKEDIEQLIIDFKRKLNKANVTFTNNVLEAFRQYQWPGNIRELFNVVSYCDCLNTNIIDLDSLPIFFKCALTEIKGQENTKVHIEDIIEKIEEHGFLDESIHVLNVMRAGKIKNESYGRRMMRTLLLENGCVLTDQQLRLRIEVLRNLGLLNVRKGRAGTTITSKGETFLDLYKDSTYIS